MWSVCWSPFNICHYAPEHCECSQIRHFTMDPSYCSFLLLIQLLLVWWWFPSNSMNVYRLSRTSCFFSPSLHGKIQEKSSFFFSFRIFCNQTCLCLCMSDLDHNLHSYKCKVYSIKSSCNKMCSFTSLSSQVYLPICSGKMAFSLSLTL